MDMLKHIGQRLREARQRAGWTQEQAAVSLGIAREYLSLLETGKRNPPLRLLARLADLYGCPVSWFYGVTETTGTFQHLLQHAEHKAFSPQMRAGLNRFCHLCHEIAELRSLLNVSKPLLPSYPSMEGALEWQAQGAARAERARLGINDDPVPGLVELLEDAGIPVLRLPLPEGELSGAMASDAEKGGFLLVNANESPHRQLWTVAHEYAHLLTDRDKGFWLDPQATEPGGGRQDSKDSVERFADRFAAHFLLPEPTMRRLVEAKWRNGSSPWVLIKLRRLLGVGYHVLLVRLQELGYLTAQKVAQSREESLWVIERRFFGEASSTLPSVSSSLLWKLALEAALHGEITLSACADLLNISPAEVQDILAELEVVEGGAKQDSPIAPSVHRGAISFEEQE
jgi:Zn-dependent peptidase ImmA (M78 family)/transcriptional regulator with XRE-family HTH domain